MPDRCEIFILAGGLSTRMGRDKSRVRVGLRTMLAHIRTAARQTGLRVRVIRRDAVARCGPLGGIYTGLIRSRADVVMFLACDMPFVKPELLKQMLRTFRNRKSPSAGLFAAESGRAGFPCVLRREAALEIVCRQLQDAEFSLQALAKKLRAGVIRPPHSAAGQLSNINTPAELKKAQTLLKRSLSNTRKTDKVARC
jgi:molybdopterin-guanine dinucleotide biosynthesis protein A